MKERFFVNRYGFGTQLDYDGLICVSFVGQQAYYRNRGEEATTPFIFPLRDAIRYATGGDWKEVADLAEAEAHDIAYCLSNIHRCNPRLRERLKASQKKGVSAPTGPRKIRLRD